jgi:hypothetical protein
MTILSKKCQLPAAWPDTLDVPCPQSSSRPVPRLPAATPRSRRTDRDYHPDPLMSSPTQHASQAAPADLVDESHVLPCAVYGTDRVIGSDPVAPTTALRASALLHSCQAPACPVEAIEALLVAAVTASHVLTVFTNLIVPGTTPTHGDGIQRHCRGLDVLAQPGQIVGTLEGPDDLGRPPRHVDHTATEMPYMASSARTGYDGVSDSTGSHRYRGATGFAAFGATGFCLA